jgi:cell division protein FtsB
MALRRERQAREAREGVGWTDARPLELPDRGSRLDAEGERRRRIRRQLWLFLLGTVFVAGSAAALFGERGYLDVRRSERRLEASREALYDQVETVRVLRNQVRALETRPMAVERVARERLGLVREGEIILLLPPEHGPSLP